MCLNGGRCSFTNTTIVCLCPQGFTGLNCEQDIDECSVNTNPCENNAACLNSIGSYQCICLPQNYGPRCENIIEMPRVQSPQLNSSVVVRVEEEGSRVALSTPCDLMECLNNSTCLFDQSKHIYKCQCSGGFTGKNCETHLDSVRDR